MPYPQLLESLVSGKAPERQQLDACFSQMLNGDLESCQVAGILVALRALGETADILTAGAAAMRSRALLIDVPASTRPIADNCGTGGDGQSTFNISTAAAVVAAANGVHVFKHGNRSVSSKCGSADLLFALGFPDSLSQADACKLFSNTGFSFLFAPNAHPALKGVMPIRKALGIRTVFNLLGPLANPVQPDVQLLGVARKIYLRPMAEALSALGCKRALIVCSQDGLDEISPSAKTDAIEVKNGDLFDLILDPIALGAAAPRETIAGGDVHENVEIFRALLSGKTHGPAAAVSLNAGALLWLFGKAPSIQAGFLQCKSSLANGLVQKFFDEWIKTSRALANGGG